MFSIIFCGLFLKNSNIIKGSSSLKWTILFILITYWSFEYRWGSYNVQGNCIRKVNASREIYCTGVTFKDINTYLGLITPYELPQNETYYINVRNMIEFSMNKSNDHALNNVCYNITSIRISDSPKLYHLNPKYEFGCTPIKSIIGPTIEFKAYIIPSVPTNFVYDDQFFIPNLEIVSVVRTSVSSIGKYQFVKLYKLRNLDLSSNKIRGIMQFEFTGCGKIEILCLAHNNISFLEVDSFGGMNSLKTLDLSYNSLSHLTNLSFRGVERLSVFKLGHNLISTIRSDYFHRFSNLKEIFLEHNLLKSIDSEIFSRKFWESITSAHFENNKINSVVDMSGVSKIISLDLSDNNIIAIPLLPLSLQKLNLSKNSFVCDERILSFNTWAKNWQSLGTNEANGDILKDLKCFYNGSLSKTNRTIYTFREYYETIGVQRHSNLSENGCYRTNDLASVCDYSDQSRWLICRDARVPCIQMYLNKYQRFNISGAKLINVAKFVDEEIKGTKGIFSQLTNLTPSIYVSNSDSGMLDILYFGFESANKTTNLSIVSCGLSTIENAFFGFFHILEWLDLSSNQINQILPTYFKGLEASLKVLILAKNYISYIHVSSFTPLTQLHILSLASNKITTLAGQNLPPRLYGLYLDDNFLSELPISIVTMELNELTLTGNDFICTCPLLLLLDPNHKKDNYNRKLQDKYLINKYDSISGMDLNYSETFCYKVDTDGFEAWHLSNERHDILKNFVALNNMFAVKLYIYVPEVEFDLQYGSCRRYDNKSIWKVYIQRLSCMSHPLFEKTRVECKNLLYNIKDTNKVNNLSLPSDGNFGELNGLIKNAKSNEINTDSGSNIIHYNNSILAIVSYTVGSILIIFCLVALTAYIMVQKRLKKSQSVLITLKESSKPNLTNQIVKIGKIPLNDYPENSSNDTYEYEYDNAYSSSGTGSAGKIIGYGSGSGTISGGTGSSSASNTIENSMMYGSILSKSLAPSGSSDKTNSYHGEIEKQNSKPIGSEKKNEGEPKMTEEDKSSLYFAENFDYTDFLV